MLSLLTGGGYNVKRFMLTLMSARNLSLPLVLILGVKSRSEV